jgi:hypothetical protein
MARDGITSRIVRPGEPEPPDRDWLAVPIPERIAAVWELTRLCYAWRQGGADEPRLQRTVVRVRRSGR